MVITTIISQYSSIIKCLKDNIQYYLLTLLIIYVKMVDSRLMCFKRIQDGIVSVTNDLIMTYYLSMNQLPIQNQVLIEFYYKKLFYNTQLRLSFVEKIYQLRPWPNSGVVKKQLTIVRTTTVVRTNLPLTPMALVIFIDSYSTINKHSRSLCI